MMKPIRDTLRNVLVMRPQHLKTHLLEFISFIISLSGYLLFWLVSDLVLQMIMAASTAMLLLSLYLFAKTSNTSIALVIGTLLACCLLVDGVLAGISTRIIIFYVHFRF